VELHRRNSASFRLHVRIYAVVVVEGATISLCLWSHHHARPRTSPELFCWLIFVLAVDALPFFVGLAVFMMALHGGAGVLGAPIVGIAAGGMTLAIGQTAFAMTRSVIIRTHHCCPFCCAGDTCWLSGRICDVTSRRTAIDLA
jgi:hypothetical protein